MNPNATIRNSFTQVPGSPGYDAIAADNGMAEYDTVDIAGAQALLEEAGVATPIQVRFHYAANNPRRASEYELIRDSAAQAGFEVIDGNSPNWGTELPNTDIYDAALFGWQSTAVAVADTEANFVTGGANNYYGYSERDGRRAVRRAQGRRPIPPSSRSSSCRSSSSSSPTPSA